MADTNLVSVTGYPVTLMMLNFHPDVRFAYAVEHQVRAVERPQWADHVEKEDLVPHFAKATTRAFLTLVHGAARDSAQTGRRMWAFHNANQ